jgi:hypothetical protein
MSRTFALAMLALGAAPPALAQEFEIETRATLAAGALDEEDALAPASDGVLGDASFVITRSDVFENGLTLAWRGEVRLQRDADARPAFAGRLGACPPANAACPSAAGLSPVAPATGLAAAGGPDSEDVFIAPESASVSLSGPWGEGVAGLDAGAAARLDARAPQVLTRVSAFSPGLDPTGLVTTRARNDVTGPSLKATYMTPRLLGFRLGASYTPRANQRGVDFDPDYGGPGLASADLEDVWEGAVSFARRFPQTGVRLRAAVTATQASSGSPLPEFGDYEGWGAGLELEKGAWTGGLRWLSSDNAWAKGSGDYEAIELGVVRQGDRWRLGAEAGWSTDDLNRSEGFSWLVGATRKINDKMDMGLAYVSAGADFPNVPGGLASHKNVRNGGLVIELGVRN